MQAQDLVDPDTVFVWTLDHISSHGIRLGNVFVYGIYSPLPVEAELLSVLRDASREFSVYIPAGSDEKIFCGGDEWAGIPKRTEYIPLSNSHKAVSIVSFQKILKLLRNPVSLYNIYNGILGDFPGG